MTASLAAHIAATHDEDLVQRLIAAAQQAGVAQPETWVRANIGRLVAAPVADDGSTVSSVLEYARAQYHGRPGENPDWVRDDHLRAAVTAVNTPTPADPDTA